MNRGTFCRMGTQNNETIKLGLRVSHVKEITNTKLYLQDVQKLN